MLRYQVKPAKKLWNEPGPDLLRRRPTAIAHALSLMDVKTSWWFRKRQVDGDWWPWNFIGDKPAVERHLFSALPTLNNNQICQLGLKRNDDSMNPRVVIRCADITVADLPNATPAAEEANALYQRAFPGINLCGAFVCKRIEGSSSWSDHSWGDAVDECEDPGEGVHNDEVFAWAVRMAREGEFMAELIIGSQNGRVVQAVEPNFVIQNSSASSSHQWHVHHSCRLHSGVPPCA